MSPWLQWIETIGGVITAGSAAIAVWRYFFALDLPINLTVTNNFAGEASEDGRQTSASASYHYRITNVGETDVQIAKMILRRQRPLRSFWHLVHDSEIAPYELPRRLPPKGNFDIWVTIERAAAGTYRLIVREYGSHRSAKFMLSELERVQKGAP